MTDAMDALFLYAQEHRICPLLNMEPEFIHVVSCLERQDKSFRTLLDEATKERFDKFLDEQALLGVEDAEPLHRKGISNSNICRSLELTAGIPHRK